MTRYIPKHEKFIGPPASAANHAVIAAIKARCIECPYCMEPWHVNIKRKGEAAIQMKLGRRCITVRRAMYQAYYPDEQIADGHRITSRCKNPNCANPRLLMQAQPGYILGKQYANGVRDRAAAIRHLVTYKLSVSKISDATVIKVRDDKRKGKAAAHEYGLSPEYYNAIQRRAARAKVYA